MRKVQRTNTTVIIVRQNEKVKKYFWVQHQVVGVQALSWDSCLPLILVASHPQKVFNVPSRWTYMSEARVDMCPLMVSRFLKMRHVNPWVNFFKFSCMWISISNKVHSIKFRIVFYLMSFPLDRIWFLCFVS